MIPIGYLQCQVTVPLFHYEQKYSLHSLPGAKDGIYGVTMNEPFWVPQVLVLLAWLVFPPGKSGQEI